MNNKTLIIIWLAITIAIVAYRAYRRNRWAGNVALSSRDQSFASAACDEGLRCLGYSCEPDADNDAEAVRSAILYCRSHGEIAVIAASLAAAGMVAHYAANHNLAEQTAAALMLRTNELLAAQFSLTGEHLHDERMCIMTVNRNAQRVAEIVSRHGFESSRLGPTSELGKLIRNIVAEGGRNPI